MSDFTSKDHKGLMEAYASIYSQPEKVIEEQVDQEIYSENVEVDPDFLVDVIVEHLITEGYTKTENQALDIIPHISDAWLDNIIETIVIKEHFIGCVNSLVEEGYDLSSYTWDELYEDYNSHLTTCLNEVAPALAAPLAWPAIAAGGTALIGGAAKLMQGMQRQKTDPASQRWLETGSYETRRQTPKQQRDTAQQRRQQAAERLRQRQQAQTQQASAQPSGGTPSPESPKPPKGPNLLQRLQQAFKQSTANRAAQKAAQPPGPSGPSGPSPRMQKATDILTHPFTKGAAATFTGTSVLGDLRGGAPGLRGLASLPVGAVGGGTKAIGYLSGSEGIKQTGRDIEKLGRVIRDGGEKTEPKPEKPKQPKKPESLPGFE